MFYALLVYYTIDQKCDDFFKCQYILNVYLFSYFKPVCELSVDVFPVLGFLVCMCVSNIYCAKC